MRGIRKPGRAGRVAWLVLAAEVLAAGCEEPEMEVGRARLALGEPQDGFPDWQERVIFEWTNRARCDPAAALAGCTVCAEAACYSPVPPLVWNHNLARSARFHSANLVLNSAGLRHDSPCTLVPTIATDYVPGPCSGLASCACVGGTLACSPTCTTWDARVRMFGTSPSGENIAYGSTNPDSIFTLWLWEPDSNPACGWRTTNGHRANILGGSRAIGVGRQANYFTQDFAGTGTPSGVVSGVHYPQTGTSIQFWANWYSTAAPASAVVNIDGTCTPLARARGSDTNGAWTATVTLAAGACHRYYFRFTSASGIDYDYPTTGSFGINCADWEATRPATCGCTPACAGRECGPDGCGGSCGSCPAGSTCNASGLCVCTPSCAGRECGPDGCGGSCGSCPAGFECNAVGDCVPAGADADADADLDVLTDTGADADAGGDADLDGATDAAADADAGGDADLDGATDTAADSVPGETTCDPSACNAHCRDIGAPGGVCRSDGECDCIDDGDVAGEGSGDAAGDGGAGDDSGSGCSCAVPPDARGGSWVLLGAAAALLFRRRRGGKRIPAGDRRRRGTPARTRSRPPARLARERVARRRAPRPSRCAGGPGGTQRPRLGSRRIPADVRPGGPPPGERIRRLSPGRRCPSAP